jgi:hypothetical protein
VKEPKTKNNMSTPFKMRGFSGFGNSPLKKDKTTKPELKPTASDTVYAGLAHQMGWMSIEEARKHPDSEKINWNLGYKNIPNPLQGEWKKATKARTKLKGYKPTSEEISKAKSRTKK